jgi:hypothetical protein
MGGNLPREPRTVLDHVLDDQATPQLRRGSGQIAADRVLDHKRFGLPLRLLAAAQSRLGRGPPRTAMPAGEHHPIPGLDDMAERPQVPG